MSRPGRYEIAFYSEASEPVARTICADAEASLRCIEKGLKEHLRGIYAATLWGSGSGPETFTCFYINSQGEIFNSSEPLILSREQAAKLGRRPPTTTPMKDRRRMGDRRKGDRRK